MTTEDVFQPREDKNEIEIGDRLRPLFDSDGLIPCITVDAENNEVLMFAFMNELALRRTVETGNATYWSRSRKKLWIKGEESGNHQRVRELRTDCDQDVILLKVDIGPTGAACHTGYRSCFYRILEKDGRLRMDGGPRLFDPKEVYRKKT